MRRAAIIAARTLIVLLLGAAVLDLKVPGRSRNRIRVHLVDRSASVLVPGPAESLKPEDADAIIARDAEMKPPGDVVTWASFARDVAFESKRVADARGTDLAAALRAALARNPTEIVLYTDGRGDPGDALFLCRDRGIPVHVFPLGPIAVNDVRITRIEAPAEAAPGSPVPISVTLISTLGASYFVHVGAETHQADLPARVPVRIGFTLPGPGDFHVQIDAMDDCRENNEANGSVLPLSSKRRVLLLSTKTLPLQDVDVTTSTTLNQLETFDTVVLNDVRLSGDQMTRLAAYAENGGGVLLLGDRGLHLEGVWRGTPIERISPFSSRPDLRVAVVLGVDSSGSMNKDGSWDLAVEAIRNAARSFDSDDTVVAMTFGGTTRIPIAIDDLRKITPSGGTNLSNGIQEARIYLSSLPPPPPGRRHMVLMTDGELDEKETPEMLKQQADQLGEIGLTIVTTNKRVPVGENVKIDRWKELEDKLGTIVGGIQQLERNNPGPIDYREHPATKGAPAVTLSRINRTTAKTDAQVVATVGQAPTQDPVLAFRQVRNGRVGAFTVPYDARLEPLFRRAIEYVAGDGDAGLTLSIDPPFVRAHGTCKESSFTTTQTPVEMKQVASNLWEGLLPPGLSGTVVVRKGRAVAAATIPCPPEFEHLGVDRAALDRIAKDTGGRVLMSDRDLAALPRPETPAPRSGRPFFLLAALALVFVELAVVTFWKV